MGDRWALLVIRGLMFFGQHEYKELLAMPEGISTNILADRLKRLEMQGIIGSIPHWDSKVRKLYFLTASGKDLIDVLIPLILWSVGHFRETVKVPPEKEQYIHNPDALKRETLKALAEWEASHLDLRLKKKSRHGKNKP